MYKITIDKIELVAGTKGNNWAVIAQEEVEGKEGFRDVYGYTPEIESTREKEIEVLRQTVEDLDIAVVIKAINGL